MWILTDSMCAFVHGWTRLQPIMFQPPLEEDTTGPWSLKCHITLLDTVWKWDYPSIQPTAAASLSPLEHPGAAPRTSPSLPKELTWYQITVSMVLVKTSAGNGPVLIWDHAADTIRHLWKSRICFLFPHPVAAAFTALDQTSVHWLLSWTGSCQQHWMMLVSGQTVYSSDKLDVPIQ